jgi:hypothetical protein
MHGGRREEGLSLHAIAGTPYIVPHERTAAGTRRSWSALSIAVREIPRDGANTACLVWPRADFHRLGRSGDGPGELRRRPVISAAVSTNAVAASRCYECGRRADGPRSTGRIRRGVALAYAFKPLHSNQAQRSSAVPGSRPLVPGRVCRVEVLCLLRRQSDLAA